MIPTLQLGGMGQRGRLGPNPNLLTKTEQFDNAAWIKSASTVAANTIAAPDGATTADTLTASATSDFHFARQVITTSGGLARVHSIHVKRNNNDWVWISPFNSGTGLCWFNTSTGNFGSVAAGVTATKDTLANGWYRLKFALTTDGSANQASLGLSNADTVLSFSAAGTEAVYVWGAQFEAGTTATPYQAIG